MQSLVNQKPTVFWTERMNGGDNRFTAALLAKSDKLLDSFLHNLSKARETGEMWKAVELVVKGFDKLNIADDGFIDTEERDELAGFIKYAAEIYGLKYEGDVTEEWRLEW